MFQSDKLKEIREKSNISETDLMFELYKMGLKISRQTILNWECGATAPGADDLAIIATFFKKPIQYFFE